MAAQTQTIRRGPVASERTHDYLYDQHYMVASERDHARATFKAHTGVARVKRMPNYPTMFSELRHFPRFQVRLDPTDPVPRFISRQWRGYADQAREALVRHTTFNFDPAVKVPAQQLESQDVSGANRYKYFRRPIIPFLQQVPPDVVLASARREEQMESMNRMSPWQDQLIESMATQVPGAISQRAMTPLSRTIQTQTDYRESEAQTDPYTPEYVVRPGSQPELLTLATLSWGRGLPAGQAEVEMIERARQKRAWEATLPLLSDVSQLDKRRRMMDDMETKEWALREAEIEKLQEARLQVLTKLLKQREEHHQEINTKRLDRLWAKKQEEKERQIKKIRNEHIKTIRKLTEKRRKVENLFERRDMTHDYSSYSSQVYAPLTRIGCFLDRGSEQYNVKSRYLSTYEGLCELENSLPDFVMAPRLRAPKPKSIGTMASFTKRKYKQEMEVTEVYQFDLEENPTSFIEVGSQKRTKMLGDMLQLIKEEKTRVPEPPKPLIFLQKIDKPHIRPDTPTVAVPDQDEEDEELAIIFLQQVIRGRAVQNMMFEGKEKRIELIKELRSTHSLQEAERLVKKQEKQATLALQRQRRLHEHKESFVHEGLSVMEGGSMGDTLDFLSKELVRLQEERKVHAFSMLAERQRRIREADESGRRQVEERRRREEDEIFKQVVKVHQISVDTYLEDVILESINRTADGQARAEVQAMADAVNNVAHDLEARRTLLESEEIVAELVHGFLLPEVQKKTMHEKVHAKQRKHLLAAHKEINKTGEGVIGMMPNNPALEYPTSQVASSISSVVRMPVSPEASERSIHRYRSAMIRDDSIEAHSEMRIPRMDRSVARLPSIEANYPEHIPCWTSVMIDSPEAASQENIPNNYGSVMPKNTSFERVQNVSSIQIPRLYSCIDHIVTPEAWRQDDIPDVNASVHRGESLEAAMSWPFQISNTSVRRGSRQPKVNSTENMINEPQGSVHPTRRSSMVSSVPRDETPVASQYSLPNVTAINSPVESWRDISTSESPLPDVERGDSPTEQEITPQESTAETAPEKVEPTPQEAEPTPQEAEPTPQEAEPEQGEEPTQE